MRAELAHQPRTGHLHIRLTAEEAASITELAEARGLSVSDFVRESLFRRRGLSGYYGGRRTMAGDEADIVRRLSAIGEHLRQLAGAEDATDPQERIAACLDELQIVVSAFG